MQTFAKGIKRKGVDNKWFCDITELALDEVA